ncbi:sortase [Candidatus Gottesmanbacteria bacterium]|nr:sortase [Candidatus Gottesmanbacteria bacterium]
MKKYTPTQIRFLAIRTLGNFLVLGSILGMFLTFGPAVKTEIEYRYNKWKGVTYVVADDLPQDQNISPTFTPTEASGPTPKQNVFFSDILARQPTVQVLSPVDTEFGIVIPKIAANTKVISDVDASNYDEYIEALREGVAHALGTYFPGEQGNIYLFAHSTDNFWNVGRYNAVFYLLKELEAGDEVDLYYQGIRHRYTVTQREIVDPDDTHFLTDAKDTETLTLQTCWPPGTTLKRLIVVAKPVSDLQDN